MITVIQVCKQKDWRYQKDIARLEYVNEVLTPEGSRPSQLRNMAAKEASGEVLLFLDDDSSITQQTINSYVQLFNNSSVQIAGGPAEIRDNNPFGDVLSSFFAMGPSSSRYKAKGTQRSSSEQELILCNLAVRKECFKTLGGFNENIYPWEENDFLIKAEKQNIDMIYDPLLMTKRGMTKSLLKYLIKISSYGESRGKLGGINRAEYIVALMFIPLIIFVFSGLNWLTLILAFLYAFLIFVEGLVNHLSFLSCLRKVLNTFFTHIFYCLGLWRGTLKRLLINKRLRHFLYSSN